MSDSVAVADMFAQALLNSGATSSTIRGYLTDVNQFLDWLSEHSMDPEKVKEPDLDKFLFNLARSPLRQHQDHGPYARASILRKLSAIRRFFSFLLDTGAVKEVPTLELRPSVMAGLSIPRQTPVLPPYLVADILKAPERMTPLAIRDRAILALMLLGGLGVTEIHNLNSEDISPDTGRVTIVQSRDGQRETILEEDALSIVAQWLRARPLFAVLTNALFVSMHRASGRRPPGGRISERGIRQVVDKSLRMANLKADRVSCLSLRKTCSLSRLGKTSRGTG